MLEPYELLEFLHEVEANAKRERLQHWGPRTLDLDIVFYDKLKRFRRWKAYKQLSIQFLFHFICEMIP